MRPFGLGGFGLNPANAAFNPVSLFASGEKGGIWLPEYSDVAVASGVGTVTDISGNAKNATQGTAGNKPVRRNNATTGFDYWDYVSGDDWLETAAIDMSGTDAVTVFAAVRKISVDAVQGIVAEFSATVGSNPGFLLTAPPAATATYGFKSRGSVNSTAITTPTSYAAPITNVLTGIGKIATDTMDLRVNGASVVTGATDQGSGNYGSAVLYIGRRGGTTFPFTGHIYGLIVLGRTATATEIANVERMFATRCGATLA